MHCYEDDTKQWDENVVGWRDRATEILELNGYSVLNPVVRPYTGANHVEIVEADLEEVRKSDGVLAYLPVVPMAGSPMEIFFAAHILRLPVCAFPAVHTGPWFKYFTKQYERMDEAIAQLIRRYEP